MKKVLLLTTYYLLFTTSLSLAQPMTITAGSLLWDKKEKVVTLKEEVTITFKEGIIKAPLVKGFGELRDLKRIEAEGGVVVIDNQGRIITGKRLEYFKDKGYALVSENAKLVDESDSLEMTADQAEVFFKERRVISTGDARIIKGSDEFKAEKIFLYDEGERIEMTGEVKGVIHLKEEAPLAEERRPLKESSVMVVENNSLVTGRVERLNVKEPPPYSLKLKIISSEDIDGLANFTKQRVGQTIEVFSNQKPSPSLPKKTIQGRVSYSGDERGGRFWIREIKKVKDK